MSRVVEIRCDRCSRLAPDKGRDVTTGLPWPWMRMTPAPNWRELEFCSWTCLRAYAHDQPDQDAT